MQKIYKLKGLDCANCAMKIENAVQKLKGVQEAVVDFATSKLFVEYVEEELFEKVKQQVLKIEPDVSIIKSKEKEAVHKHQEHTGCGCHHQEHDHGAGSCGHHEHEACSCGNHEEKQIKEHVLKDGIKLYVRGLDCASCANKIEQHILRMKQVQDASLNFSTGSLYVNFKKGHDQNETIQEIIQIVPTLEDGVVVEREKTKDVKQHSAFSYQKSWKLYIGMVLFALGIILEDTSYGFWLLALAYLFAGGRVLLTAFKNILRGDMFDENFLMSVATIGAFAVKSYDEAVAVMIFYEVGEMFQSFAVQRSRKSIASLMDIRADYANVVVDGKEVRTSPEDVMIDDIILIKPGERVPLDGIILQGNSMLDTAALTGESVPRSVHANDEILAGVVNLNGLIHVRVTKSFGESTVSRILELVENASSKKAPMEKFITKFAKVYTPIVVALAVLLVIIPMVAIPNADLYDWLYRALTFLVVSCPCALVVSIPLGLFAGIGSASRHGILVKGGNYLEALKDIDTVVFDKTGTLTKGVFKVVKVHAKIGTKEELLEIAAYGEFYSNHPIAKSVYEAYGREIDRTKLVNYEEIAGHGVEVTYLGKRIALGNHKLMERNGVVSDDVSEIGTIIHVAIDDAYAGYIVIDDEIKETSKDAIVALKQAGIQKTIMLSGDRKEVGERVGKQLGLDEIYMQLLPADKVRIVEDLLEQEKEPHKLAFVGDGMNDAPVLARADIGVAMGGIGSDAAIEAADVVLMKDDPKALSEAIKIAKKTMKILKQNIIFSLGIKVIILILTALGIANMWMGVFADVGVTLIAVLNSMRALRT